LQEAEEAEGKEEEKVYGQKQNKKQKRRDQYRCMTCKARMQMQRNRNRAKISGGPQAKPRQNKIHYFSFFLPQIDLALDRPAGLPPGTGDSGGGGGAAGCCCFDASFRFSADVSSMYLGL